MLQVTQKQRENLLYALDIMWPAIKPEQVARELAHYRTSCGTAACFGGHVAVDPYFTAQGVAADSGGYPFIGLSGEIHGPRVAKALFGTEELFYPTGSTSMTDLTYESIFALVPDHEIVRRRLQWLLENSEVVSQVVGDEVTA